MATPSTGGVFASMQPNDALQHLRHTLRIPGFIDMLVALAGEIPATKATGSSPLSALRAGVAATTLPTCGPPLILSPAL